MSRTNKRYPDQFKREAVELVRVSGRPVGQIAEELGVSDQTLRNWVHADAGGQGKGSLSPDEKEELKLLRKENKRLRMEREILKKAATFFAQENDPR
jgi:transposase